MTPAGKGQEVLDESFAPVENIYRVVEMLAFVLLGCQFDLSAGHPERVSQVVTDDACEFVETFVLSFQFESLAFLASHVPNQYENTVHGFVKEVGSPCFDPPPFAGRVLRAELR